MHLLSILKLPAKLNNLPSFIELVSRCAEEHGLSSGRITEIGVATEEAIVNICRYAYEDETGDVQVACMLDEDNRFIIEIVDTGVPFSVLSLDRPDLSGDISERKIGGLGVFVIRELMDDVQYRRENGKNILRLIN